MATVGDAPSPNSVPHPAPTQRQEEATASSWPAWRGAHGDGRAGITAAPNWDSGQPLPQRWRVPVGDGLAGPVVADGRVFVHSRQEDEEFVRAFDVSSGTELWSESNTIAPWGQPMEAWAISSGPIATPCVAGNRLYTVGIHGLVRCFDVANGEVLFAVDSETLDGETSEYRYGHCSSPRVVNDLLLVSFSSGEGQLVALDRHTGAVRWRTIEEPVTYTSPVFATLDGKQQVILRTWERVVGLEVTSGELLWSHEAEARSMTRDCVTPLVVDDIVYLSSRFHGTIAVQVSRHKDEWTAERLYRTGYFGCATSTPIHHDGHLYGLHRAGRLACLDARTGKTTWKTRRFNEHASFIAIGNQALALGEEGDLILFELNPSEFRLLKEWKAGEYTWSHPALGAGMFFIRDREELVAVELPGGLE